MKGNIIVPYLYVDSTTVTVWSEDDIWKRLYLYLGPWYTRLITEYYMPVWASLPRKGK